VASPQLFSLEFSNYSKVELRSFANLRRHSERVVVEQEKAEDKAKSTIDETLIISDLV